MNEVLRMLERDALGLMLMCGGAWSRVLGRYFLLLCVSVPVAHLQGLGAQTAAVLSLCTLAVLCTLCTPFLDTVQVISLLMPALCV